MTREALKKLNEKQMNYCKTLSALIDRAKIKGLKEENERNRGKLRGFLECMEQMELLSGYEVKALYLWFIEAFIRCAEEEQEKQKGKKDNETTDS